MSKWSLRNVSLEYKLIGLMTFMVFVVMIPTAVILIIEEYMDVTSNVSNKALDIARMVAEVPAVQKAIVSENPSEVLQPYAERWRKVTGATFIVISNMDEIRLSHPLPEKVGTPMADLYREPVLHGQEYVYTGKGSLAPTLRANVPIYGYNEERQIGFVSVGFDLNSIYGMHRQGSKRIFIVLFVTLALSAFGARFVARDVKKAIFGLEPQEIAKILKERTATLEAIREGLVAVESNGHIHLINNEAAHILGISEAAVLGHSIDEILPHNRINYVVETGQPIYDEVQHVGDVIIWANTIPIVIEQKVVGAVISFRDRTEIMRMAEEITGVNRYVDGFRAQAHEFKNKLHTVAGLIQLQRYEEAVDIITENQQENQQIFEVLNHNIKDPLTFGLLIAKASRIKEMGIAFDIDPDTSLTTLPGQLNSGDMILILGNLLENAIDAVAHAAVKQITLGIYEEAAGLRIIVQNSGPGIDEKMQDAIYLRGTTTKGENRGLGLALVAEKVIANGGTIHHTNLMNGGVEFTVYIPYSG